MRLFLFSSKNRRKKVDHSERDGIVPRNKGGDWGKTERGSRKVEVTTSKEKILPIRTKTLLFQEGKHISRGS